MGVFPELEFLSVGAVQQVEPFETFRDAARAVLAFLQGQFGFDLWMATRVEGDQWLVLEATDHGHGAQLSREFRWSDTICARMVAGLGPRIAPRVQDVPAYAAAPITRTLGIGAYVGVPIFGPRGSLFGTLCAIHPKPQPAAVQRAESSLILLGALLSTILVRELEAEGARRRAEHAEAQALTDPLTGLLNRRAWEQLLDREEERCRRYGHPAVVAIVDLDGLKERNDRLGHEAGDHLLRRTADALRSCARQEDVVARLGGDEFAVLAVGCSPEAAEVLRRRIRDALRRAGVNASVGIAARDPQGGLRGTWRRADLAMYRDKLSRREAHSLEGP